MKRVAVTVASLVCAALLLAPVHAAAQGNDDSPQAQQISIVSFSGPVRVPGTILPAGEYVFRLVNPDLDRQTVEILTKTGKPVAILVTALVARAENNMSEVLMIDEGAGQVPALRAWFYPGFEAGHEFIYPAVEARDLSQGASVEALAARLPNAQTDMITVVRIAANGEDQISTEKAGTTPSNRNAALSHAVNEKGGSEN